MKEQNSKARHQPRIRSKIASMLAVAMAVTLLLPVHSVAAEPEDGTSSTPAQIIEVDNGTPNTANSNDGV